VKTQSALPKLLNTAVIVAALGYFVDIYDLVLFSIVRVTSLKSLGLDGHDLFTRGVMLLDTQMAGMLCGGIFWGILGDKKGRLSVLFGSIAMYSVANILNGLVTDVHQYAWLRFFAGVGLAGELGAGITLVSEILHSSQRGLGTMIVASVGVSGAILAAWVGEIFDWRVAYFIGGGLGLCLLALRIGVVESGMFIKLKDRAHEATVGAGSIWALFNNRARFAKYLRCILIGVPIWYVIGVLDTFAPELGKSLNLAEPVSAARGILFCYLGLIFGDMSSGLISQKLKSRRQVVFIFLSLTTLLVGTYFLMQGASAFSFYVLCVALGFATGYWAILVTIAAEQFGTNLRSTVATTVPNFVRGSVVPMTLSFRALGETLGVFNGGLIVGSVVLVLAFIAAWGLPETFSKDLNYVE